MSQNYIITQVSNGGLDDVNPSIADDKVVWQGFDGDDSEIYLYNATTKTTTQVTNNATEDSTPIISGNLVVWSGFDGNDTEIYLYNTTNQTTTQLTNNNVSDSEPVISGNLVVWAGSDGNDNEIYRYNTTNQTTTQLTNNNTPEFSPAISGNNIVWAGFDGNDYEIYLFNGTTTVQLSNNTTDDAVPSISGNNVVWQNGNGNTSEIYLYNGSTTIRLTNNASIDVDPSVSGNTVVWRRFDGNDNEIYLYDIATQTTSQLTNNTTSDTNPSISGDTIVWENDVTGITLATLAPTVTVNDVTVVEGSSGTTFATFTVTLTEAIAQSATVQYETKNGSAKSTSDYTATSGTLTFKAGETSKTIKVTITNNDVSEADETFELLLKQPTNANIGDGTGVGTITDTLQASATTTLPAGVENLLLTGNSSINGIGNSGNNLLTGNGGGNTLTGQAGNDTLNGGSGTDTIAETGNVNFTLTNTKLTGLGTDSLSSIEKANLKGGSGNNLLDASAFTLGAVTLDGVGGNDTFKGGSKSDALIGGSGTDQVIASGNVNFTLTNTQLTGLGTDSLSSIEQADLTGGTGNNKLNASAFTLGAVTLKGDDGNDTLTGGSKNDTLVGGAGKDTLTGGGGSDFFVFNAKTEGIDTIQDFAAADTIHIAKSFGGGLTVGALSSSQFVLGTAAVDSGDRFIYNQSNGALFFDADGKGAQAQVQIATLSNNFNLTAADIVIF